MQHFNASDFTALSPAKAKAQALAMFAAAQLDGGAGDWQGAAYALHSVVTRKRGKAASQGDITMQDSADASEFVAWNDLPAPGKGTAMIRGRVAVEFADGYAKTVGLLAGKGKPWAIGKAVAFAVACYQADAARRMVGHDGVLYCGEHYLPGLIAVPEIVSVISADSDETTAGDLVWSPDAANAATRDLRAGLVDPATYVRGELGEDCALSRARFIVARALGLMKTAAEMHMIRENAAAAERAGALLFPWHRGSKSSEDIEAYATLFGRLMDADGEAFPVQRAGFRAPQRVEPAPTEIVDTARAIAEAGGVDSGIGYGQPLSPVTYSARLGMIEDALIALPAREEPAVDPRADLAPADHATMLLASEIVGEDGADVFAGSLSAVSYAERFTLVEDALLAWPALVEPCAYVDGEPADAPAEARRPEDVSAPPAACRQATNESEPVEAGASPAAAQAVAEPARAVKPRYRFSPISGRYELVEG